jgi:hypothetical protein
MLLSELRDQLRIVEETLSGDCEILVEFYIDENTVAGRGTIQQILVDVFEGEIRFKVEKDST